MSKLISGSARRWKVCRNPECEWYHKPYPYGPGRRTCADCKQPLEELPDGDSVMMPKIDPKTGKPWKVWCE